jgi:ankyrin repeat protein
MVTIPIEKVANPPLIDALKRGNLDAAKALISKPATDVNEKGLFGHTALMWAAVKGDVELVQMLIDRHADINAKDDDDQTAYDLIKYSSRTEVQSKILEMLKKK